VPSIHAPSPQPLEGQVLQLLFKHPTTEVSKAKEAEIKPRSFITTNMSHKRYHLRDVDDSPGGPPDKRTKLEKESLLTYKPDDSNSLCAQTKRQAYQTEMEGANTAMMDIQHFPSNTDYKRDESTEHGNLQSYEEMSCEWMDALMARLYRLERTNAAFHERFTKLEQKNEKQSSKRAQTDNLRGVDMTSKEEQNQAGNSLDVVHREKNRLGRKDFELQQKFHKQSPKEAKSDRLRDVIMILKEERNQLERDLDLVQRQNDTLWRESIGLKQKVHELMNKEADADKLKDVMKTMENDRIQLEDKLKAVQQQNADLIEDTEALGNARQSVPNLDDAIENQFRDLRESVRSFTRDCSIKSSSLPDKLKLELARLFGNSVAKLLKSTLYARYLVEAYIWHFLYNYILQSPFGVWGYGRHCKIGTFVLEVHCKCFATFHH
jgi:hypothetical protein